MDHDIALEGHFLHDLDALGRFKVHGKRALNAVYGRTARKHSDVEASS